MMSCLPEIFSRSGNLQPPSKIGGVFSVNLRSASFGNKQTASVGEMRGSKTSRSVESQRYRREESMRASKSRSFYQPQREEGLEEHGHQCENLNGKSTQQNEVEAASNFNALKRQALETVHLARRTLELVQAETNTTRTQMASLSRTLTAELESFQKQLLQQSSALARQFRLERREMLAENKTIKQQMAYVAEELGTAGLVSAELRGRFETVVGQFI